MILALVGPTGSGKTHIALQLGPKLGAEVLSVDSMQVYRGMDVGTAKPTPDEQVRVPHHLIDLVDPGSAFTVAEFQGTARTALRDVEARTKMPLLVGGSGLYFRAIVDELSFPPTDAGVRSRLDQQEVEVLWARLRVEDPEAASRMQPANKRRIVRALEVIEITGRPFSSFRTSWEAYASRELLAAGLLVSGPILRARIERRTREMFSGPILSETRRLVDLGYGDALRTGPAIGYRDALGVLEGTASVEDAIERTIKATVELARRQMRWFRRDPRIRWIEADELERATAAVAAYWTEQPTAAAGGA